MADFRRLVERGVEEGNGRSVRILGGKDGELALGELLAQRTAGAVEKRQAFSNPVCGQKKKFKKRGGKTNIFLLHFSVFVTKLN